MGEKPIHLHDVSAETLLFLAEIINVSQGLTPEELLTELPEFLARKKGGNNPVVAEVAISPETSPSIAPNTGQGLPEGVTLESIPYAPNRSVNIAALDGMETVSVTPGDTVFLKLSDNELLYVDMGEEPNQKQKQILGVVALIRTVLGQKEFGVPGFADDAPPPEPIYGPTLVVTDLQRMRHEDTMQILDVTAQIILNDDASEDADADSTKVDVAKLVELKNEYLGLPSIAWITDPEALLNNDATSSASYVLPADENIGNTVWLNLNKGEAEFFISADSEAASEAKVSVSVGRISLISDYLVIYLPAPRLGHFAATQSEWPQLQIMTRLQQISIESVPDNVTGYLNRLSGASAEVDSTAIPAVTVEETTESTNGTVLSPSDKSAAPQPAAEPVTQTTGNGERPVQAEQTTKVQDDKADSGRVNWKDVRRDG